jgi:hypothetical protein
MIYRAVVSVILTYSLSLILGHFIVVWLMNLMFGKDRTGGPHPRAWAVGLVERTIYTSCLLLGLPFSAIGGWLVLKGLVQFNPKGTPTTSTIDFLTDYYSYLIGTGLSLIVGVGFGLLGRLLLHLPVAPRTS